MFAKFSNLSYSCHVRIICCLSFLRLLFAAVANSLYLDCCYSTIVIRNVCVSVFIPFHLIPFHSIFPVQVIKIPNKKPRKKQQQQENTNDSSSQICKRAFRISIFSVAVWLQLSIVGCFIFIFIVWPITTTAAAAKKAREMKVNRWDNYSFIHVYIWWWKRVAHFIFGVKRIYLSVQFSWLKHFFFVMLSDYLVKSLSLLSLAI